MATTPAVTDMPDTGSAPAIRTAVTPQDDHNHAARHRVFLAAATSDNTRQAYRSAVKHYLDWGGVLPANEPAVIRYLVRYADTLNPRTLALLGWILARIVFSAVGNKKNVKR